MVILDFNTLSGTKPQILTPKRYDDHPIILCEVQTVLHI